DLPVLVDVDMIRRRPSAGPASSSDRSPPFPHGGAGVTRMAKASERQIALGRRTARVCSIDGRCIATEVLNNPLNIALDSQKPVLESATLQIRLKLVLAIARQRPLLGRAPIPELRIMLGHELLPRRDVAHGRAHRG